MSAAGLAKTKILSAAAAVVGRSGAAHLTIDAVAAEAKLSKGGVLYHFPSKRAILEGMLDRLISRYSERIGRFEAELGDEPDAAIRAVILADRGQDTEERSMALALLAAAAEDPELLAPARAVIGQWFEAVEQSSGNVQLGILLLLATEGLRFLDMLDLLPAGGTRREQLGQTLLNVAEAGRL
jgi:AcrR family transcriptional regulator